MLLQNKLFVVLRINFTKYNIDSIYSIIDDLKNWNENEKKYVKIDLQRVWQDNAEAINIDKLIDEFNKVGFNTTSPDINLDSLRDPCYADNLNQLLINYDGSVFKCTARDFGKINSDGYLNLEGEVVWTKLNPFERISRKMSMPICKTCTILPLCGGGCVQKIMENKNENNCLYGYDETAKKEIVLNRFYNYFVKNSEKNTSI